MTKALFNTLKPEEKCTYLLKRKLPKIAIGLHSCNIELHRRLRGMKRNVRKLQKLLLEMED
jgi:hypothetical protein